MQNNEVKGDWSKAKEKLKARWDTLTDHDLQYVRGKMKNLVGRIRKRTGETEASVQDAIQEASQEGKAK